jgi:hypothetical protein
MDNKEKTNHVIAISQSQLPKQPLSDYHGFHG